MPRRKNYIKSWTGNLPKRQKTWIEESLSDSEDTEFFPGTSSDEEFPSSDDEELDSGLKNEADLYLFNERLQAAHNRMVAEQKAMDRKRPKHYTRNSERTKKRHRRERKEMERKGFQSIGVFFKPVQRSVKEPDTIEVREFCPIRVNPSDLIHSRPIPMP